MIPYPLPCSNNETHSSHNYHNQLYWNYRRPFRFISPQNLYVLFGIISALIASIFSKYRVIVCLVHFNWDRQVVFLLS